MWVMQRGFRGGLLHEDFEIHVLITVKHALCHAAQIGNAIVTEQRTDDGTEQQAAKRSERYTPNELAFFRKFHTYHSSNPLRSGEGRHRAHAAYLIRCRTQGHCTRSIVVACDHSRSRW